MKDVRAIACIILSVALLFASRYVDYAQPFGSHGGAGATAPAITPSPYPHAWEAKR